jgi:hypothetical protein
MPRDRLTFVLLFSLLLAAASCKKDDNATGQSTAEVPGELVGSWRASSATVNGNPSSLSTALGWESKVVFAVTDISNSGLYGHTEFDSSGGVVHSAAGVLSCTGPSIYVNISTRDSSTLATPQTLAGTWASSGMQMTLTYYDGTNTIAVTSTRIQ